MWLRLVKFIALTMSVARSKVGFRGDDDGSQMTAMLRKADVPVSDRSRVGSRQEAFDQRDRIAAPVSHRAKSKPMDFWIVLAPQSAHHIKPMIKFF